MELIITLAVSSILIGLLTSLLTFANSLNFTYRENEKTLHSANNLASSIKNLIDFNNDGNLVLNTSYNDSKALNNESIVFRHKLNKEIVCYYATIEGYEYPRLFYYSESNVYYAAKSEIDLNIKRVESTLYEFKITYKDNKEILFLKNIL